jgi:hypothetical protein
MRIPDDVKKCVAFIGIKKVESVIEELDYCGTGFIASVQSLKHPRISFPYLVTAKHIAEGLRGIDIFIRINTKDGKSAIFRLGANEVQWWYHPEDKSCDVALLPLTIPQDIFQTLDYAAINSKTFLTEKERLEKGIGEGDDVFTVGLFYHHQGDLKNPPIVRMGNIAMIPSEPIETKNHGNIEAYLIELRSMSGLSGSPVFVLNPIAGKITKKGLFDTKWQVYLLGLNSGHWETKSDKTNVGIAYVSPAKKILETINQAKLQDSRALLEARYIANKSPRFD